MSVVDRVVGEVLAHLVRAEHGTERESHLLLRLVGFAQQEIEVAMRCLEPEAWPDGSEVTLKVASYEPWDGAPKGWFLGEDETQVTYRNNPDIDLVLFEVEDQCDSQSVGKMQLIQDGTVLESSSTGSGDTHRRLVGELAWSAAGRGPDHPLPEDLSIVLEEVFHVIDKESGQLALRAWVEFVVRCCEALARTSGAVSRSEVHDTIVDQLPHLRLFRDEELFSGDGGYEKKRLVKNVRMAGMNGPTGKELDEEDIERRISAAVFRNRDGEPLPEQEDWQKGCLEVLQQRGPEQYAKVPLSIWEQIFAKEKETKAGLGTRVRKHIEKAHPDRVAEYEGHELQTALDDQESGAARVLLEVEPEDPSQPSLGDILTKPLRKAAEKLASPRSPSVPDPLVELLHQMHGVLQESEQIPEGLELRADELDEDKGESTLAFFRFLYGRTLREMELDEDDEFVVALRVDSRLVEGAVDFVSLHSQRFPSTSGDEQDESSVDEAVEASWEDLRLQLVAQPGRQVLARFTWSPKDTRGPAGLVAFARLVLDGSATRLGTPWSSLDAWCEHLRDPRNEVAGDRPDSESGSPVEAWLELRGDVFEAWAMNGIDAAGLSTYVDAWREILDRALVEFIPSQEAHPGLEAFLEMETLQLDSSGLVLLGTHPTRLRWVAAYLGWVRDKVRQLLTNRFRLNPEVDELFFQWLGEQSPHRQPPVISPGHQDLSIATREYGWHEEYRPIVVEDARSEKWVSSIDGESVSAMVGVVKRYLDAHPHKVDGLAILFISRDGEAEHVERLVKQVRAGEEKALILTVHVIAPQQSHEEIARKLEDLGDEDRSQDELLPRLRTILHPLEIIESPDQARRLGLDGQIDLAMVPNLLGLKTAVQTRTQGPRPGRFDPLFDDPTHDTGGEDGAGRKNVARDFLPFEGDALLEGWSSLQVWRKQWSRTGTGDTNQVDYFSLQVLFTSSAELFANLHDWAHWVVTLDPYVNRDQIEASDRRPDIITVQPKVGKNGRYTMVVSSSSGRDFVVNRLQRRIRQELSLTDPDEARSLANQLYDSSRDFAPGVVLRALGLGRTTQEILGLVVARRVVEERRRRTRTNEFEAWLSLDEMAHWFGGVHRPRADMLRVLGRYHDGQLNLRFQVVEAKFRENESMGRGEAQLSRSIDVLRPAFLVEDGESNFADAELWRRELLAAIEQCAGRSVDGASTSGLFIRNRDAGGKLSAEIRSAIAEGKYRFDGMEAILCTVGAGNEDLAELEERTPEEGHTWLRVGASGFRRVLRVTGEPLEEIVEDRPPVGNEPATETAQDAHFDDRPEATTAPVEAVPAGSVHPADRGLGKDELAARYQRVLALFSEFKILVDTPVDFVPIEGPAFYEIRVKPGRGVKLDRVLGQTREMKLRLALPEHLEIRGLVDRGSVVFQVPKEDDERYFVGSSELWARCGHPEVSHGSLKTPIGEDASGAPVWIDFGDSDSPHLLIGGTTGSGKSVALESILEGLCAAHPGHRLRLLLVDPKGTELNGFEGRPHLEGEIGMDADDAIELLEREVAEMERRYKLFKAFKKERGKRVQKLAEYNESVSEGEQLPWRLIVLDEYADLTSDKEDRQRIEPPLQRIAQKGRASGIHVIVATQKPSGEIISTAIRSNLPAQLALRVKTATDSRIVMDETGAESLAGKGDAFLKTQKGVVRVQTAFHEA